MSSRRRNGFVSPLKMHGQLRAETRPPEPPPSPGGQQATRYMDPIRHDCMHYVGTSPVDQQEVRTGGQRE